MFLSCTVSEIERDQSKKISSIWRPVWGDPVGISAISLVSVESLGVVCVILGLAVLVEFRLLKDRRRDTR